MKKYILLVFLGLLMAQTVRAQSGEVRVEASAAASAETSGIKSTIQTQVRVEATASPKATPQATEVEVKDTTESPNTERVLPTVNKKTGAKVTVKGWNPTTKEDIQERIDTQLEADADIRSVEIAENGVKVSYATPARLFGFIPMTMNLNIVSDTEGRVKVSFPWYRFMVKSEFSNAEETLNTAFQHNQSNLEFLKVKGSAEAQVEIFETISKAMHDMAKSIIQNIRA